MTYRLADQKTGNRLKRRMFMKCSEPTVLASIPAKKKNIIQIPMGLLGFETIKNYALLSNPKESPFLWLEAQDNPAVTFLIMPPSVLYPTYQPEISQEDVRQLALERAGDAMVLGIVLLLPDGKATVNLRGPIIVNRNTLVARQVVPIDGLHYNTRHPLPVIRNN